MFGNQPADDVSFGTDGGPGYSAQADTSADAVTPQLLITWALLVAGAVFLFKWYGRQAERPAAATGRSRAHRDPQKERMAARQRQLQAKGGNLTAEEALELMQVR